MIEFYKEIDDIELFFQDKFKSLINKFIEIQAKYLMKLERDYFIKSKAAMINE